MSDTAKLANLLEGYDAPAILVSDQYEILANNRLYEEKFGKIAFNTRPKCYAVSHGYSKPCDQAGEDCPLLAAKESKRKEKVLHIHQTPNGREHVDVEMIPIFNDDGKLSFFVELLKPVPLASGNTQQKQVVGRSPTFLNMLSKVTKVAATDASVLLLGESGTGKELISQLVHMASSRSDKPMVTLECSGLSETLIESELFGHTKGAFTGAYNDRKGMVEHADGGTLFLDEIGDVSLSTQVKLLRLIETKTFRKVGGTEVKTSDFRLVCATHRNLKAMVENGQFRLDLYHRINVFPILIPPLSARQQDIPLLVEHVLNKTNEALRITDQALHTLTTHRFAGNIRELKNIITRAIILSDSDTIDAHHIHEAITMEKGLEMPSHFAADNETQQLQNTPDPAQTSTPLKHNEHMYISQLLERFNHDKQAVAAELGISVRTLYRKLKQQP